MCLNTSTRTVQLVLMPNIYGKTVTLKILLTLGYFCQHFFICPKIIISSILEERRLLYRSFYKQFATQQSSF